MGMLGYDNFKFNRINNQRCASGADVPILAG